MVVSIEYPRVGSVVGVEAVILAFFDLIISANVFPRGFYSAQTMVDNLGFTLTPDSMVTFRDATWPMLIMTFLAFAGNTLYPVLLRLTIYVMSKVVPARSSTKEALQFLLDHPRRCYTLLFPSGPTWVLFVIIAALNLIDVVLIIVLDLDNPAINDLPMGPRVLSALFQAASSRHTGTSTLNLALINPAVQFSLLVMMYIAILPIAISIRASNTYEEKSLGMYKDQELPDESDASSYVVMHFRNQLSFDLWYIFLGTFCICVAESQKISDPAEPVCFFFILTSCPNREEYLLTRFLLSRHFRFSPSSSNAYQPSKSFSCSTCLTWLLHPELAG